MIQKIYFRGRCIVGKPCIGPYDYDEPYRKPKPDEPKPDFIKEEEFKVV